jgi:uncharacterized protein with ParB-like and HNH nuclease domain
MKDIFDSEEDKLVIEVPKEERYINTSSYDYSVGFIVSMMSGENAKIILEVPFQRQYVWKDDKASQLIESIIMNVPIPPIYFAEEEDGKWLVIDGLQRLNSLLRFFQNEFGLKKLDILEDIDKHKYKDLPPKAKSLLDNGQLRANVIRKDSHPDIKYDVFMRLNKGAVTLNYQELRNCLYRGSMNNLAKKIVEENKDLLEILNLKSPHNRFLDVEFVVRFFALYSSLKQKEDGDYYIKNYKGRMVTFLNNFMESKKVMSEDEIDSLESTFNETLEKVVAVFSTEKAFRDISTNKTKANKALADAILLSFTCYELEDLVDKKEQIEEALIELLEEDEEFRTSISQRTSDKDVLNIRITKWIKKLDDALEI